LFGAEHANVQPHSGSQANMAVYLALFEPGDKLMGMRLDQGGHLTHGSPVNFSGRLFHFVSYGVTDSDERLDYNQVAELAAKEKDAQATDKAVMPGVQGGPLDHVIAAKAVCFWEASQPEFKDYAAQVVRNARALAQALASEGFRLVSGGTDNHLMLVDLRPFDPDLTGQQAR